MYKCGDPGTSKTPDLLTKPLASSVFNEDSDSTPLISETFNLVTGCSYATIERVSSAGVDKPLNIEGGLKSFSSWVTVSNVNKSASMSLKLISNPKSLIFKSEFISVNRLISSFFEISKLSSK